MSGSSFQGQSIWILYYNHESQIFRVIIRRIVSKLVDKSYTSEHLYSFFSYRVCFHDLDCVCLCTTIPLLLIMTVVYICIVDILYIVEISNSILIFWFLRLTLSFSFSLSRNIYNLEISDAVSFICHVYFSFQKDVCVFNECDKFFYKFSRALLSTSNYCMRMKILGSTFRVRLQKSQGR